MDDASNIIDKWIEQLRSPDLLEAIRLSGGKRRIDVTLYSDRGHTSKPPSWKVE